MIYKKSSGVSLIEVVVSVAILGGVVFLCTLGIKMLNLFDRQRILAETELGTQRLIYMIERDIRNSYRYEIIPLDDTKPSEGGNELRLATQDFLPAGTTYTQNLGDILNIPPAQVIYQYVSSGGESFLRRRMDKGGQVTDKNFLVNVLDVAAPIFKPIPNYEGVHVEVSFIPAYRKGPEKKTYTVSVLKWFNSNEFGDL